MKRVVIVGGGPGGAYVAHGLDQHPDTFSVTLIDTKPFFEMVPMTPSLIAGTLADAALSERAKSYCVSHSDNVVNGRVIVGRVVSVATDFSWVRLADGKEIPADIVILATGSRYDGPWKVPPDVDEALTDIEAYAQHLARHRDALSSATSFLVLGGGTVGVEVAAELASSYPKRPLTLVQSAETLLPQSPPQMGRRAIDFFKARENVTLILGERASPKGDGRFFVTEKTGQEIEADVVLRCVGVVPNTSFLSEAGLGSTLDARGFIRVDDHLRVEGAPKGRAFALGDCAALDHTKMAKTARDQGIYLANSLLAESAGPVPPETPGMFVSLGPGGAVANLGYFTLIGWTSSGSWPAIKMKMLATPYVMAGGLRSR